MTRVSYEINTWQSILWRLVVTALLLIVLAGTSVSVFNPENQVENPFTFVPVTQDFEKSASR